MLTLLLLFAVGCAPSFPDEDIDGDGVSGGVDCDDADATSHPDAFDFVGDDVDRNCDGADGPDADQDGFADLLSGGDDCDDSRADVHPGAEDAPYDGLDADCAGDADADVEGDGDDAEVVGGPDCDDADAEVYPGAIEVCDGVDQDCDGETDEDARDATRFYDDLDGDGYGEGRGSAACAITPAQSTNASDCDDADAAVHPGAEDRCGDGIDGDCVADVPACGLWADADVGDAAAVFRASASAAAIGRNLGGGHDLTGDGGADLIVGVSRTIDGETAVAIFAGPRPASADVDDADARILQADMPENRGALVVAVMADLTGDGEPDVLVGNAYAGESYEGQAAFFSAPFTGTRGTDEADARVVTTTGGRQALGTYFVAPGDLTGDGVDDFAVTTDRSGLETYVFAGTITGDITTASAFGHVEGAW
jgi:hypothetical protein